MSYRLPPIAGEWIDRQQRIPFTFEGQTFWGYAGDTISSALWAAGQRVLGRSFKYHRPRGILSLANHDVNTLMQNGQVLNVRADVTPIAPGMNLSAINTFGGVMGDRASVLNFFSSFLPVGFYYKAFHTKHLFPFWEQLIRKMTGLGTVDISTPRIRTPKRYDFCDILIIGAGVSGLAAALAAAEAGANVVIVDENAQAGGSGQYQLGGNQSIANKTTELVNAVTRHPRICLYTGTQAAAYYADHWIPLVNAQCMAKMRAKAVIIASGAYEQPAVFHNNDLPGVMLASAAQRLIYRYAVKPMHRAVILTANSDGYRAALDLVKQGIEVKAIVNLSPPAESTNEAQNSANSSDYRDHDQPPVIPENIPIYFNSCIYEARPNPGKDGISAALICPLDADGNPQPAYSQTIPCDGILMSIGWAPAANLLYQAGTTMQFNDQLQQFIPTSLPKGIFACGRVNGIHDFAQKIVDGDRAGSEAASYLELTLPPAAKPSKKTSISHSTQTDYIVSGGLGELGPQISGGAGGSPPAEFTSAAQISAHNNPPSLKRDTPSHPSPFIPHPKGKNFVDFDEDLQLKDFFNAAQEGFNNIELLKRYTTVGMGPSQGKHSNINALRILAHIKNKAPDKIGTTTARPFFHPVPLSHLAGHSFIPDRQTPLHSRHTDSGAKFLQAGNWQRPDYYTQPGKSRQQCIQQEAATVRNHVGMIDVGTLGKLELRGSDAAQFLERVYTGKYATMKPGTTRYALMLDESGVIIDDGVIAKLAPDHFYFTTTTSGSTAIYRELSRLNTLWQLDCGLINLTGAKAAINLAGPRSPQVLAQLTDLDLSSTAFPYLAVREADIAGIPALLMRVGFVGEWGYEIHIAAEHAPALWDALLAAGEPLGIRPFGVEAQRLLRLEKGHLIIGQDTDGLTTPCDANLGWAVKMDKSFFIGQRSLQILSQRSPKQKLVGFILDAHFNQTPPQECHLIIHQDEIAGRITSIGFSSSLQKYIGLAYLKPELAEVGNQFSIRLSDRALVTATVSPTPFYDPENLRQKEEILPSGDAHIETPLRTSPIPNQLQTLNTEWQTINGMPSITKIITDTAIDKTNPLAIIDLSCLNRFGVKGAHAAAWLKEQDITIPEKPNSWCPLADGSLIARLGLNEFLIEDSLNTTIAPQLKANCQHPPARVYPVLRQDLAIALYGTAVNELLLQTCNINFQALNLSEHPVVLTSMIGVAVTIIPGEFSGTPFYRIWCDGTYGNYFWQTLLEMVEELDGSIVGIDEMMAHLHPNLNP